MGDNVLAGMLGGMKLSSSDVKEIVTLAKTSNYQLACQKHFDITHPGHYDMQLPVVSNYTNLLLYGVYCVFIGVYVVGYSSESSQSMVFSLRELL